MKLFFWWIISVLTCVEGVFSDYRNLMVNLTLFTLFFTNFQKCANFFLGNNKKVKQKLMRFCQQLQNWSHRKWFWIFWWEKSVKRGSTLKHKRWQAENLWTSENKAFNIFFLFHCFRTWMNTLVTIVTLLLS